MLLSCRIIPHNVFTDTASNSLFNPSSNFPRLNSIGSTDLFISGMVDYQINQHREIKAKIPVFSDLHRMVARSCRNDQIQKYYRFTNFHPRSNTQHGDFLLPKILREWVAELSGNLRKTTILAKEADIFCKVKINGESKSGVLTIYRNHLVKNFRHKHETIKCKVAGVGITSISTLARET